MKKIVYFILIMGWCGHTASGQYYEVTTDIYTYGLTLNTGDSLYMTDGGFDSLELNGDSTAVIHGTSPLRDGYGGIQYLLATDTSELTISGGQINQLSLNGEATMTLTGGMIYEAKSNQQTQHWDNDNDVWIQTPHILFVCSTHSHDVSTNILTGTWRNGTPFSIQLVDSEGYGPAIDNIQFVPEPAAIVLLGLGGIFLRRRNAGFVRL